MGMPAKTRPFAPLLPGSLARRIEKPCFTPSRLNSVAAAGYGLRALFPINNIRQEQALKSELLAGIYHHLTLAGIAMR